jgi:hypothetical protein
VTLSPQPQFVSCDVQARPTGLDASECLEDRALQILGYDALQTGAGLPHPHGGGGGRFDNRRPPRDAVRSQAHVGRSPRHRCARCGRTRPRDLDERHIHRTHPRPRGPQHRRRGGLHYHVHRSPTDNKAPPALPPPAQAGAAVGLAILVLVATARLDGLSGDQLRIATDAISATLFVVAAGIVLTFVVALSRCPTLPEPEPAPVPYQTRRCRQRPGPAWTRKALAATPIVGRCEQLPESSVGSEEMPRN